MEERILERLNQLARELWLLRQENAELRGYIYGLLRVREVSCHSARTK